MTPALLTEYLKALKACGVRSGLVAFEGTQINVVFDVEMGDMPGEAPEPGGWKGPAHLDDHTVFDEQETPVPS